MLEDVNRYKNPFPKEDIPLDAYPLGHLDSSPSMNKKYNHAFTVVENDKPVWYRTRRLCFPKRVKVNDPIHERRQEVIEGILKMQAEDRQ
ncbi:hypothetical protein TNCV_1756711 [Trichonephila clavipes]|nr:hypothetical protein TNCV_1756711 [Trichonephila clavipes]